MRSRDGLQGPLAPALAPSTLQQKLRLKLSQAGLVVAAADTSASSKARRKRKAQLAAAANTGGGAGAAAAAASAAWANPKAQQRAYQEAWLAFLRLDLPADIYRKVGLGSRHLPAVCQMF
jgi:hypothetical protein